MNEAKDPDAEASLLAVLPLLNQTLFLRMSVREALWGGQDHPLLVIASGLKPEGKKPPFTKFGFFVGVRSIFSFFFVFHNVFILKLLFKLLVCYRTRTRL